MKFRIREEKPKIAIDVDGTLSKTVEALLEKVNKRNNTNYVVENITDYEKDLSKICGSWEKVLEEYDELWGREIERISPHVTLKDLLKLEEEYEIIIVTNRKDKKHKKFVREWLKRNFGLEFEIILVGEMEDKIKLKDYELIIDDSPVLAEAIRDNPEIKKLLILVERPWNRTACREADNKKIFCVESTKEAIMLAISIANEKKKSNYD
jgi:5'(3')-deoxyribonucleotidase